MDEQRWCVGDGGNVLFWLDNWGNVDFPLVNSINLSILINDLFLKVRDYTDQNGE